MSAAGDVGTGEGRALVVAKAPVAGRVKTRLGADIGLDVAAELASLALLDTLEACATAFAAPGFLALEGDLADAVHADELAEALRGWEIYPQRGDGFGERLRQAHHHAHELAVARRSGPVVQLGMDTPHAEPAVLRRAAALVRKVNDAVLAPAYDGGWWLLALRDPALLAGIDEVEMSTDRTGADTQELLERNGARVLKVDSLADVDTMADGDAVAAAAPHTRFARRWREVSGRTEGERT